MKLRDRFHSWRKPIYSVPTRRGLIPLALTAFAGFEAFFRGSVHHQWIVVLMSVFTVMHLIDASADLRSLELAPDPDSSVFAGTPTKVNLFQSGRVSFPSLHLVAEFAKPGIHLLPAKKVEHRSEAGLFHFWRTFRFQRPVWVLPAPVNHGAPFGDPSRNQPEDPDQLAPIRDPRLLHLRDLKIERKTGKSVMRIRSPGMPYGKIILDWEFLRDLPEQARFEQIAFWIRTLENRSENRAAAFEIRMPFFSANSIAGKKSWRDFKRAVAEASVGVCS